MFCLSVCLSVPKLACSQSTNDTTYLTHNKGVKFSLKLLRCRVQVLPALYSYYTSRPFFPPLISACAFCRGFCTSVHSFWFFFVVRKQLSSLLDSLLHLQHNLLLRHRGTRGLVGKDTTLSEHSEDDISDEEIPSNSGSNEGSDCDEGTKNVERRRKRKRRCPWVRGS